MIIDSLLYNDNVSMFFKFQSSISHSTHYVYFWKPRLSDVDGYKASPTNDLCQTAQLISAQSIEMLLIPCFSLLILWLWNSPATLGFTLTKVAPTEIRVVEGQPFSVTCTSDEYYKVSLSIYSPPTTLGHLLPALYLQTRDQELRSPLDVRGEQRDLRRV